MSDFGWQSTSEERWRDAWVAAWATIGWYASTDILQGLIMRKLVRLDDLSGHAFHNLQIDVKNLQKKAKEKP